MKPSGDVTAEKRRLRRLLGIFFLALAIPSAVLSWQAYSRLKWESFHQYQLLAEEFLERVDRRFAELITREQARAFTDYRFLVVEGAPEASFLQRSVLSAFPVRSELPGLLGYFQIDADGRFTTPLLPLDPTVSATAFGVSPGEAVQRETLARRLHSLLHQEEPPALDTAADRRAHEQLGDVLNENLDAHSVDIGSFAEQDQAGARQRPGRPPAGQKLSQSAFDRLGESLTELGKEQNRQPAPGTLGRLDELKLDQAFDPDRAVGLARSGKAAATKDTTSAIKRREQNVAPILAAPAPADSEQETKAPAPGAALVSIFESEVDPFEFGRLDNGHFVLFRKVWRDGRRHIQGMLIEQAVLLRALIEQPFRASALATMSRLGVGFDGQILFALDAQGAGAYLTRSEELSGTLLYRGRMSAPASRLELVFSVTRMPTGSAGALVIWVVVALGLTLCGGLLLMYRLGARQIELAAQQRDFVSAVSHELKTPLTSIRMYSEMLREGWADESRKRSYYAFIHDESERLSRLIANVLQLARMGRGDFDVEPVALEVGQLLDLVQSKVATQVEQAGFEWKLECRGAASEQMLLVDPDAFAQILINLVDNALKFSAAAERRAIVLGCSRLDADRIEFSVRDFGPGIASDQMQKIFQLFYRSENELTRETVGTGIGLALVQRLAGSMGGDVNVVNADPGAEFRVRFPIPQAHTVRQGA